jgi:DNA processing protein
MHTASLCACLALHHIPQLSNRQRIELLRSFDDPAQMVQQLESGQSLANLPATVWREQIEQVQPLLEQCQQQAIAVLPISSPDYPSLLREIHNPPALLYVRGDSSLLEQPQLAIVGSRKCSNGAADNARRFAETFAQAGCVVTSGLALGIDAASHRGALQQGGKTIAVLGTGVDVAYPRRNQSLYQQIIEAGVVVSELPLGAAPLPSHFPSRNRIISGLSLGVLVIEAALQSGSLITARLAMEQNREVFAMPGSIHNPASRGCHELIRQGAKLVETAQHILEEFSGWACHAPSTALIPSEPVEQLDRQQSQLLRLLTAAPQTVDALQQQSGLAVADIVASLLSLELAGWIESQAGIYQRLK